MKYFSQIDIFKNAIKPATYIYIIYGCNAEDIFPPSNKYQRPYLRDRYGNLIINEDMHPTEKQLNLLHNFGIMHTRGLNRSQASKLISIILERDKKGLALPWQLQIIQSSNKRMSVAEKHTKYASLTKYEAGSIIEHIETINC